MVTNIAEYSVSEISFALKKTIETSYARVKVRGEISGYRGQHSSGHAYFALKDDRSKLDIVIWRSTFSRLANRPEEGMEVIAVGKLSSYPGSSRYQLILESLEPAGIGALMKMLEQRREKLASEGLFADERKQRLPFIPNTIGIITSPTGAVIRDILHRLQDRYPLRVILWPARMQGDDSARQVTRAIDGFNDISGDNRPDLLIIARGGGSLEDLWPFNDEDMVRAAAASRIPIISAIGHETDWTLLDYVADHRAPTPTAAAEIAVPVRRELLAGVKQLSSRLDQSMLNLVQAHGKNLQAIVTALPRLLDFITLYRQRFDHLALNLDQAFIRQKQLAVIKLTGVGTRLTPGLLRDSMAAHTKQLTNNAFNLKSLIRERLQTKNYEVAGYAKLLKALSYRSILQRGFALVRDGDTGKPLYRSKDVKGAGNITIEMADDKIAARVVAKP